MPEHYIPFVGWKGLVAEPDGVLHSPQQITRWPPRERLVAECNLAHPSFERCFCGIYAVKTFEDLKKNAYNWGEVLNATVGGVWVIAEVMLWGEVRRGRIGYRAQFAYPKTIYIPGHKFPLGKRISDLYGCKLKFINRFTGEVI